MPTICSIYVWHAGKLSFICLLCAALFLCSSFCSLFFSVLVSVCLSVWSFPRQGNSFTGLVFVEISLFVFIYLLVYLFVYLFTSIFNVTYCQFFLTSLNVQLYHSVTNAVLSNYCLVGLHRGSISARPTASLHSFLLWCV